MTRGSSISSFFKKLSVKGSRGKTSRSSQQKDEQIESAGSGAEQIAAPPAPVDIAKDTKITEASTEAIQQGAELENDCKLSHSRHQNDFYTHSCSGR